MKEDIMEKEYSSWENYMLAKEDVYKEIMERNFSHHLISEANWVLRCQYASGEDMGIEVKVGDICYLDYGQVYLNEMGYQHFGLVMALSNKKAFIIPMTSSMSAYEKAYDPDDNPSGKTNLMRLGWIDGLVKVSTLFLNDCRFINTARVIQICGHIDKHSDLFKEIQRRMRDTIRI